MVNPSESSPAVKPYWKSCTCPDCVSSREADALAARIGMAGPTVDPDTIAWGQIAPYHCPLPTGGPAEAEAGGPSAEDEAARWETVPTWFLADAPYEWELSPHEQALEMADRADDLFSRWAAEAEEEREIERRLGW